MNSCTSFACVNRDDLIVKLQLIQPLLLTADVKSFFESPYYWQQSDTFWAVMDSRRSRFLPFWLAARGPYNSPTTEMDRVDSLYFAELNKRPRYYASLQHFFGFWGRAAYVVPQPLRVIGGGGILTTFTAFSGEQSTAITFSTSFPRENASSPVGCHVEKEEKKSSGFVGKRRGAL